MANRHDKRRQADGPLGTSRPNVSVWARCGATAIVAKRLDNAGLLWLTVVGIVRIMLITRRWRVHGNALRGLRFPQTVQRKGPRERRLTLS